MQKLEIVLLAMASNLHRLTGSAGHFLFWLCSVGLAVRSLVCLGKYILGGILGRGRRCHAGRGCNRPVSMSVICTPTCCQSGLRIGSRSHIVAGRTLASAYRMPSGYIALEGMECWRCVEPDDGVHVAPSPRYAAIVAELREAFELSKLRIKAWKIKGS